MAKLWAKGYELDKAVEQFTVGEDYMLDMELVRWDCIGSVAHAAMLAKIGVLTPGEFKRLKIHLNKIIALDARGKFTIARDQEDVHTAIENDLTERLGDVGKKLHTARSRNDQIILDLRLYMRDKILATVDRTCELCNVLLAFAEKNKKVPVVGRTHYQRAMPSSLGLWAGAIIESLLDDIELLRSAYVIADQCPLGSAASYGVNLDIDRQFVSYSLGFARVQNNVLYANNSRGKFEAVVLSALTQIMIDLSKLANDIIFWSLPEFGYLKLPQDLCGGSSLMPQKRNPALFELTRAKAATVAACHTQVIEIVRPLISGYHRDFQETKKPLMVGVETTLATLAVCALGISKIVVDEKRCVEAFSKDVFATDRVLNMVKKGVPFRDAYKQVALSLEQIPMEDPRKNILGKKHIGSTGNLGLNLAKKRIVTERVLSQKARRIWITAIKRLMEATKSAKK